MDKWAEISNLYMAEYQNASLDENTSSSDKEDNAENSTESYDIMYANVLSDYDASNSCSNNEDKATKVCLAIGWEKSEHPKESYDLKHGNVSLDEDRSGSNLHAQNMDDSNIWLSIMKQYMAEYKSASLNENTNRSNDEDEAGAPNEDTNNSSDVDDEIFLGDIFHVLDNASFPDKDRTPLIQHISDVIKLLTAEVDCTDKTAIFVAKFGGIKHLLLDRDFCNYLCSLYGEDIYTACYQIATYDYHDREVDCNCRDLRCRERKFGTFNVWRCYCNVSDTKGYSVSKNKIGCRKDQILEECLKKRRKKKLKAMGESAKVALLSWMIIMVRKFKSGNIPVDWEKEQVDNYLEELVEMWTNLGMEKGENIFEWLDLHPSNNIIMKLRLLFTKEVQNINT